VDLGAGLEPTLRRWLENLIGIQLELTDSQRTKLLLFKTLHPLGFLFSDQLLSLFDFLPNS
jgi:hypothetical protein